jgi:hypothetical protein
MKVKGRKETGSYFGAWIWHKDKKDVYLNLSDWVFVLHLVFFSLAQTPVHNH